VLRPRAEGDGVWLESGYRAALIKRGLDKAKSMNQLGRELGYRSRVHPGWSVRQILLGQQPFPLERLEALAGYVDEPLQEALGHRVARASITKSSTEKALKDAGLTYAVR